MKPTQILRSALLSLSLLAALGTTTAYSQQAAQDILTLVQNEDYDGARAALAKTEHNDLDALFLEAQIFTRKGQVNEAIAIYRAILAAQPDQVRIRQVLAQTLFQIGEFESSRFHFRKLLEAEQNPQLRAQYANALSQIQKNIPSGVSASFSFVPSSNINRGTNNETIEGGGIFGAGTISDLGRKTSGIGFQLNVAGFHKIPYGDSGLFTFTAAATQVLYTAETFNIFQPSVSVRYDNSSPLGIWSLNGSVSHTLRRGDLEATFYDYTSYALSLSGRRKLSGPNILTYSLTGRYFDPDSDANDSQKGPSYELNLGGQRQLNAAHALIGGFKVGRGLPQSASYRYKSLAAYMGVSSSWPKGWSSYVGLEAGKRNYDENFGFFSFKRDDGYQTLTASVLNSNFSWRGISPRVTCSYTENRSNVAFFDYNSYECNILMTKDF